MTEWTPSLVEARLAEAAYVLKRLPKEKVQGYFSTWPTMLYEFSDLVGQEPIPELRIVGMGVEQRVSLDRSWRGG